MDDMQTLSEVGWHLRGGSIRGSCTSTPDRTARKEIKRDEKTKYPKRKSSGHRPEFDRGDC